jgi:hypothetical protein
MINRTFMAVIALIAIVIITFLALWRDRTKTTDVGSSAVATGTATPPSTLPLPGFSRLNEMVPGRGNLSEQATQTPVPVVPSRAAPERASSREAPTTPVPGSPIKDATGDAVGTPAAEAAALSEKPSRLVDPAVSATASTSPSVTVSESASDKLVRVQLAARMQGPEPGPPIDLPVRLSQGQSRTIYFFTELRGLSGRSVLHRWERNGRIMHQRQLRPASQSWRAYSAMTITGDMRGSWRISAVDATAGKVLAEQRFEIE